MAPVIFNELFIGLPSIFLEVVPICFYHNNN